ncbi:MAG: YbhB/YbcL family Raf kinase inhibitor-like protein [Bacteroidia bacterium]
MLKKILIAVPSLIIILFVARLVFVSMDQSGEQDYHDSLEQSINLWSDDFESNGAIPAEFTALGESLSPSLFWDNLPPETKSLAFTIADYDGPSPTIKLMTIDHWVLFNIDPKMDHFDKAVSLDDLKNEGIDFGLNIYSGEEYVGPDPGFGNHKYYFRIYALSVPSLDLTNPTRKELLEKMEGNILAYGELVGTFSK